MRALVLRVPFGIEASQQTYGQNLVLESPPFRHVLYPHKVGQQGGQVGSLLLFMVPFSSSLERYRVFAIYMAP